MSDIPQGPGQEETGSRVLLSPTAGQDEHLTGDPAHVVGGIEYGDPGDILGLADAAV
jgi:hypothetical protein